MSALGLSVLMVVVMQHLRLVSAWTLTLWGLMCQYAPAALMRRVATLDEYPGMHCVGGCRR